jgi:hypothetical protein
MSFERSVILSGVAASLREAAAQSKDPYKQIGSWRLWALSSSRNILSPFQGWIISRFSPRACALGYILTPLRGSGRFPTKTAARMITTG